MRTWQRVDRHTLCGGCGAVIPAGAPMLLMTISTVKRARWRCVGCAGEAPPDLPATVVSSTRVETAMEPLRSIASQTRPLKAFQRRAHSR